MQMPKRALARVLYEIVGLIEISRQRERKPAQARQKLDHPCLDVIYHGPPSPRLVIQRNKTALIPG
jgi:hypothetical protein